MQVGILYLIEFLFHQAFSNSLSGYFIPANLGATNLNHSLLGALPPSRGPLTVIPGANYHGQSYHQLLE